MKKKKPSPFDSVKCLKIFPNAPEEKNLPLPAPKVRITGLNICLKIQWVVLQENVDLWESTAL